MTVFWIVFGLAVLAAGFVFFVARQILEMITAPDVRDPAQAFDDEARKGRFSRARYETEYRPEPIQLASPYGYKLSGLVIARKKSDAPSDGRERVVILVHGFTSCLQACLRYVDAYRDLGFSCVLYDHRNHGASGKAYTTMGYYEADDLGTVAAYARKRFGADCILGVHGESMGAATAMLYAGLDDKLAFVTEDCGYSSWPEELAHVMRTDRRTPRFPFLPAASLLFRLRTGLTFSDIMPIDTVRACKPELPMLFLHGDEDNYVPTRMALDLYEAKRGVRRIRIFPSAGHAMSCPKNPELYRAEIRDFLSENNLLAAAASESTADTSEETDA